METSSAPRTSSDSVCLLAAGQHRVLAKLCLVAGKEGSAPIGRGGPINDAATGLATVG